jgi:hypothetical protein
MLAPKEWEVTRLAVDGAVSSGVLRQLDNLPASATHLVISAGGNDALGASSVLDATAQSVGEVLMKLAEVQDRFKEGYARMLDAAEIRKLPTAVCSVYDPRFPDPIRWRVSAIALSVINDVITREAFSRRFTLIDLRLMFADDRDFANPRAVSPRRHEVGARHTSFRLRSAAGRNMNAPDRHMIAMGRILDSPANPGGRDESTHAL